MICTIKVTDSDGEETSHYAVGHSYSLRCTCSGFLADTEALTYYWRKNGNSLTEAGSTLTLSNLILDDAGQYICTVTRDNVMYSGNTDFIIQSESTLAVAIFASLKFIIIIIIICVLYLWQFQHHRM